MTRGCIFTWLYFNRDPPRRLATLTLHTDLLMTHSLRDQEILQDHFILLISPTAAARTSTIPTVKQVRLYIDQQRSPSAASTLGQRLRRFPNVKPALDLARRCVDAYVTELMLT